ncbi:hypothetical protein D3C87_1497260 [compost metagenome]|uniref:hypothetical protein n=1 Tax=Aeromonas rivipollensis TaxID=948519 RepID=UPI000F986CCD|nr:hypothetical protein [Aeromonas rivipollensis]NEX80452.1 hypothetical protein [Aeromonas rivipollensis]
MKKAEYQKRFSLNTDVTFKPNAHQKKVLRKAADNQNLSISDYANEALTKSLIEEDDRK